MTRRISNKDRKSESAGSRRSTTAKRSKSSAETRDALLSAARLRFAVDGFQAANLRSIASDAGVDVALISRYFRSKDGLFQAVIGFERKRIADATQNAGPKLVRRLLENVLADPLGEKGDLLSTLLRSPDHPPALEYMVSILKNLESDLARLSTQPDKKIRASLVTALLLGIALQRRVLRKLPLSEVSMHRLTPIFSQAISILLDGA